MEKANFIILLFILNDVIVTDEAKVDDLAKACEFNKICSV